MPVTDSKVELRWTLRLPAFDINYVFESCCSGDRARLTSSVFENVLQMTAQVSYVDAEFEPVLGCVHSTQLSRAFSAPEMLLLWSVHTH